MPEVSSEQVNLTVGAPVLMLYQPVPAGDLSSAAEMVGLVASRLMVTELELVPPALVAEQVRVVPAVSVVIVVEPQPVLEEIAESGSDTVQLTVTSLTYQPLLPRVPATFGVMLGAVVSAGAFTTNVKDAGAVFHWLPVFPPVTLATLRQLVTIS